MLLILNLKQRLEIRRVTSVFLTCPLAKVLRYSVQWLFISCFQNCLFTREKKKVFLVLLCFYVSDFDLLTLMVSFRNEKTSELIRDHDIKLCEI